MKRMTKIHWGFPIATRRRRKRETLAERGVALMIAVVSIAMVMMFTADLILSSQVALELAVRSRDSLKAEYMAKSGTNLALFLLAADFGIDVVMKATAKTEVTDSSTDFWTAMNGIPIGGDTIELIAAAQEGFDLNSVNDSKAIDMLKLFDGQFVLNIEDEASKLNVNTMFDGPRRVTESLLESLMSCPAEREFLRKHEVTPKELVYRLKDYIDKNNSAETLSGTNDENDGYSTHNPAYKAKNAPLDSLDELRMVEGWNDEIFAVFSPYLTIWPVKDANTSYQINLNTASREFLSCLFPKASEQCEFDKKYAELKDNSQLLAANAAGVEKALQGMLCANRDAGGNAREVKDLSKNFGFCSQVFRITTVGEVGDQQKTLETIVQRQMPNRGKKVLHAFQYHHWNLR